MKKAILFISLFALFLAACTRPASTDSTLKAPQTDTTGLAAFQEWKFQNERAAFDDYQQLKAEAQVQEQAAPVVYKKSAVKRKTTASKPRVVLPDASNEDDGTANTGSGNSGNTGSMGSEGTNTGNAGTGQEVAKKKTSNAVKGAVIGAGTGAVLGAVINKKNRVLGGVIGGVLGGAVGYGIGKSKDKKEASTNDYSLMTSN